MLTTCDQVATRDTQPWELLLKRILEQHKLEQILTSHDPSTVRQSAALRACPEVAISGWELSGVHMRDLRIQLDMSGAAGAPRASTRQPPRQGKPCGDRKPQARCWRRNSEMRS